MTDEYGHSFDIQGSDVGTPPDCRAPAVVLDIAAASTAVLYWPVDRRPLVITQWFGGQHKGLDFGIKTGEKYYSTFPVRAQVVWCGWNSEGYGNGVGLKADSIGAYVIIGHMQRVNPDLRVGAWVEPGGFLGTGDSTGNSTGPHCHLELRVSSNGYYPYPASCRDPYPSLQWRGGQTVPPEPTPPPPTPTGNRWKVIKKNGNRQVSVYQQANKTSRVVDHYDYGEVITAQSVAGKLNWLSTAEGFVMIANGNNLLLERA